MAGRTRFTRMPHRLTDKPITRRTRSADILGSANAHRLTATLCVTPLQDGDARCHRSCVACLKLAGERTRPCAYVVHTAIYDSAETHTWSLCALHGGMADLLNLQEIVA